MKKLILFAGLAIIPFLLHAQADTVGRFSISAGGGLAIPVGAYGSQNANQAAVFDRTNGYEFFVGFAKEENGFAKTGYNFNLGVSYQLRQNWLVSLTTGKYSNPVNTEPMSKYLTDYADGREIEEQQEDYNTFYLMPGLGYSFMEGKFQMNALLHGGYANADFPYFRRVLLYSTSDPKWYVAHEGEQPALHSFIWGLSLTPKYSISRSLFIALDIMYLHSTFDYHMEIRAIPGGSTIWDFDDKLNQQVINTSFQIGYKF